MNLSFYSSVQNNGISNERSRKIVVKTERISPSAFVSILGEKARIALEF